MIVMMIMIMEMMEMMEITLDLIIKMLWMMIKTGRIMLRRRIDDRND